MVGKVMQWKKAQPADADRVWNEVARANEGVRDACAALTAAARKDEKAYVDEICRLASISASEVHRLPR